MNLFHGAIVVISRLQAGVVIIGFGLSRCVSGAFDLVPARIGVARIVAGRCEEFTDQETIAPMPTRLAFNALFII